LDLSLLAQRGLSFVHQGEELDIGEKSAKSAVGKEVM
jgi:hypothetical protein